MLEKVELFKEITEIRPGTYPFMDASQALILETYKQCAATVLVAVVSKPAGNQIVVDAGCKTLTHKVENRNVRTIRLWFNC